MEGRRLRRVPARAAGVGLAAAVGLVTALRAIASIGADGVKLLLVADSLEVATLGVAWSERALFPGTLQSAAAETLVTTVGVLVLACALAALLNVVVVLAEGSARRRAEYAVRSALGEAPRRRTAALLRELRTLLLASTAIGLLAGIALGTAVRFLWPHTLQPFAEGPLAGWDVVVGVGVLIVVTLSAHLGAARRATAADRIGSTLRTGDRASADPAAIFFRNGLAAFHVAAVGTTVIAALTLTGAVADTEKVENEGAGAGADVRVVATRGVGAVAPGELSRRLRAVPGIEAESLASPGALLGLGVRDIVVTQCGNCWRGLFPAPLWNELADHHAVGPGYFATTGVEIVEGRGFLPSDDVDSDPVAIVDISLARTAFEDGAAIGRKLRVGRDYARWYTVVGVARRSVQPTLGADADLGMSVWLNASQQPVEHPRVLLAGSDDAVATARGLVTAAGFEVVADRSLPEHRAASAAPIRWAASVAFALGFLLAGLVTHGLWVIALQTTLRRFPEVALRQALGATPAGVVRFVLRDRLGVTAWGLALFGVLGPAAAAAVHIVSGASVPGVPVYLAIAAALTATSLMASGRALRGVLMVEPRLLMRG